MTPMTGKEFQEALAVNGWSIRWLSRHLDVNRATLQRFKMDKAPIPDNLAEWMREHTRHMLGYRQPREWKAAQHGS